MSRSLNAEAADFLYMAWGYLPEDTRAKCKQLEEALRDAPPPEELQWKLHRDEDGSLGSFLTGRPGEAIYAIDERKPGPYRVWTLDLPELPPMNSRSER